MNSINALSSARVKFVMRSGGQFWKFTGVPSMDFMAALDLVWATVLKKYPEADLVYSSVVSSDWDRPEPEFDKVIPFASIDNNQ
jgi:hypothetical protein